MKRTPSPSPIGKALAEAVARLREVAGSTARIAVIAPATVNDVLARRELARTESFVGVDFVTPEILHSRLARAVLRREGLAAEPPAWLRATLARLLTRTDYSLPGGYDEVLRDAGWLPALVAAVHMLESDGLSASELAGLALDDDLQERVAALQQLMSEVEAARQAEGIASRRDVAQAAWRAIEERRTVPMNAPAAAILLGDARVNRLAFRTLQSWLAQRHVLRLTLPAVRKLRDEPQGLAAAAPEHAEELAVPEAQPQFRFVRTPDPVRECAEAVREVQAAILEGTPIDRIAIIIPDAADALPLGEALERAGIPATWQTGPPLLGTPAARFLLMMLDLALGEDSVAHWYELLRQPPLRLMDHVGEGATQGRGRWRTILARCGAYRGTQNILRALEKVRDAQRGAEEGETADAKQTTAVENLRRAIHTLHADLQAMGEEPQPVGAWAAALLDRLVRWWGPFPDALSLRRLLEEWASSTAGPAVTLAEMRATLSEALESTEFLRGTLNDPSVRVLTPMQALGGSFEVVLACGLTQGRFPAEPSEDPILADAMVEALNAKHGVALFRSVDRVPLEARRLAAVRSAATGRLWLSVPRVEMLEGRPLIPGSLILELATQVEGKRVGLAEFEQLCESQGRRSRPWPHDAERALGLGEYRLARLHSAEVGAQHEALLALVAHTWGRRLLEAHHAWGRLARGEATPELRPYAGFVDPAVMSCKGLDGHALSPEELASLVLNPESFLLYRMLGVRRLRKLYESWSPDPEYFVPERVLAHAQHLLDERRDDFAHLLEQAFHEHVAEITANSGEADTDLATRLNELAQRHIAALAEAQPVAAPLPQLKEAPLDDELPWQITGAAGRKQGEVLQWLSTKLPETRKREPEKALDQGTADVVLAAAIEALARRSEVFPQSLQWLNATGDVVETPAGAILQRAAEMVRTATQAATLGWYPPQRVEPEELAPWREPGEEA